MDLGYNLPHNIRDKGIPLGRVDDVKQVLKYAIGQN